MQSILTSIFASPAQGADVYTSVCSISRFFDSFIRFRKPAIILSLCTIVTCVAPLPTSAGLNGFGRVESGEAAAFEKLKTDIVATMSACDLKAQDACNHAFDTIAAGQTEGDKETLINIMSMLVKHTPEGSSASRKKRYDVCLGYVEHVHGSTSRQYLEALRFATSLFPDEQTAAPYLQREAEIVRISKDYDQILEANRQKHYYYMQRENYKKAEEAMLQIYEALKVLFGEGSEESESYTGYMATFYAQQNNDAQYEKYTLKYLDYGYRYSPAAVSEIALQLAQFYMNRLVDDENTMQEKAQRVLERAVNNAKEHGYPLSLLLDILGAAYSNQLKYDQSIAVRLELYAYVMALGYNQQALSTLWHLAPVYNDAGDRKKAIETYLRVVDQCGKQPICQINEAGDSYRRIGDIYFDDKNSAKALIYYKKALTQSGKFGLANDVKVLLEERIALIERGAKL